MGLPDTYDVLWQCDRWLLLGAPSVIPNQLYRAIEEQQWEHEEFLSDLFTQWMLWGSRQVRRGHAAYSRGYGWRMWHSDGAITDSRQHLWKLLPEPLIGGVVYLGGARRMLQGKDPFYLHDGLPVASQHADDAVPDGSQPKYGTWVTDTAMSQFRRAAVLSFGLE